MARYIDADKADVERINCFYGSECRLEDVQEWLDEQPTADVAPKSEVARLEHLRAELSKEVERLQAEVERLKKDNEYILMQHRFQRRPSGDCWNDVIEKSKAEVAREIFEEIYKSVASKIPMGIRPIFNDDRDFDGGFINGKRDALLDVLVLIAELKKKYTQESFDNV